MSIRPPSYRSDTFKADSPYKFESLSIEHLITPTPYCLNLTTSKPIVGFLLRRALDDFQFATYVINLSPFQIISIDKDIFSGLERR
jgi:hypothetical protein